MAHPPDTAITPPAPATPLSPRNPHAARALLTGGAMTPTGGPLPFVLLLAAAACGGQTASSSGYTSGVPAGLTEPDSAAPPFSADEVAATRAGCTAAHGPVNPYTSSLALGEKLVGAWLHCSPDPTLAPDWPGIEFTADGTVWVLIDDGSGGLVRGEGIDNQGTWDIRAYGTQENQVADGTPGATYYLDIYGAQAAGSPVPAFETSPRRLDYEEATSKWFVPLTHP